MPNYDSDTANARSSRYVYFSLGSLWACNSISWCLQRSSQCYFWGRFWNTVLQRSPIQHHKRYQHISNSIARLSLTVYRCSQWSYFCSVLQLSSYWYPHRNSKCEFKQLYFNYIDSRHLYNHDLTMCCHICLSCAKL
jgi:hypothetical protein